MRCAEFVIVPRSDLELLDLIEIIFSIQIVLDLERVESGEDTPHPEHCSTDSSVFEVRLRLTLFPLRMKLLVNSESEKLFIASKFVR